jgi:serine/threonine-protein kinase
MTDSQLPNGSRIGQYEIREFIAKGGMAEVYLAFNTELERLVALKIMLPALASDAQFVERFRREARTVARLDHPHIVQVFAVGLTPESKRPYIAMQYIDGGSLEGTLEQLANRGKLLTNEQALVITRQIAEALAVAHNAGVIHRDLKPSNVLIRQDGTPVLVDLGIAVVSDATKLTQTGGLIGTPHYMSPEQVRGQPLDGRSDLYALGIMLYEMLAGTRPFEAVEPVAILHKQAYEQPIPLEKRRPDLSPQVLAVVATCLQKEPERRFQRAEAMVQAINAALQTEGSSDTLAQTTAVLTHLRDSALISRQQVVRIPTAEQMRRRVPTWAIATLVVLAAAIFAFFAFRPDNQGQTAAAVTLDTEIVATAVPASPTQQQIIVSTNTAVPPTATHTATPPPTATTAPTATTLPTATPLPATFEFSIAAIQAQTQTGLQINPGQTILIEYISGSWRAGPLPTWPLVGPAGDPQVASKVTLPVPDVPIVSLIAGIGSAQPQFVGQRLQFQSETSGQLWLGANDDNFADNQGELTVRITLDPAN